MATTLLSALFGGLQLFAGNRGINVYSQFHLGWITGFQANRNAQADVLLIGFLPFAVPAASYLSDPAKMASMMLDWRVVLGLMVGMSCSS